MADDAYRRRDITLAIAEAPRAISEMASLLPAAPLLYQAPRGDGHAVLVMPGLGGSDRSTAVLRGFVASLGYRPHPWNLGTNRGPRSPELVRKLAARLDEVFLGADATSVSLIGWSLGGAYARLLAQLYPAKVRQVITLGSPIVRNPQSQLLDAFIENLRDVPVEQIPPAHLRLLAGAPLPDTPSTAVFSKSDGVVPWQAATQPTTAIAENIEVYASHFGLGFNPAVLYAAADRLAQRDGEWRPFVRDGWKRWIYGPALLEADDSPAPVHRRAATQS
jgi:pimeloyl-ACP methyl ester carboxylesterase